MVSQKGQTRQPTNFAIARQRVTGNGCSVARASSPASSWVCS